MSCFIIQAYNKWLKLFELILLKHINNKLQKQHSSVIINSEDFEVEYLICKMKPFFVEMYGLPRLILQKTCVSYMSINVLP